MFDAAAYAAQLQALLPTGPAFTRAADANLTRLISAFAEELARIDGRAGQLLDEADPATAFELLPDWERLLGLPDACNPANGSLRERRLAAAAKWAARGGQSRAYFTGLARLLGFEIDIVEYRPFESGKGAAGDPLGTEVARFTWLVKVRPPSDSDGFTVRYFSCGSAAGEPLKIFAGGQLECLIRRAAPAHTNVLFSYPEEPRTLFWFDFLNP